MSGANPPKAPRPPPRPAAPHPYTAMLEANTTLDTADSRRTSSSRLAVPSTDTCGRGNTTASQGGARVLGRWSDIDSEPAALEAPAGGGGGKHIPAGKALNGSRSHFGPGHGKFRDIALRCIAPASKKNSCKSYFPSFPAAPFSMGLDFFKVKRSLLRST